DEPLRLTAPGPTGTAHAQVLADLADRPVLNAPGASLAVAGACIQAAAVLHQTSPQGGAGSWDLLGARRIEPRDDPARAERRAAWTAEHTRQIRALSAPD